MDLGEIITQAKKQESLDAQFNLVPPKALSKMTSMECTHSDFYTDNLLFVDLTLPKTIKENYKSLSLDQLIILKTKNKKQFKKLLKEYTLITSTNNAAKILKNIGKTLQVYNKTPVLQVQNTLMTPSYFSTLEKKQHIRIEPNRCQFKVGKCTQEVTILKSRLKTIEDTLKSKGFTIKSLFLKTTQGKKISYEI